MPSIEELALVTSRSPSPNFRTLRPTSRRPRVWEASTPAGTATDNYDPAGDLTGVTYSGTALGYSTPADLSYTYYPDGSAKAMADASETTTYTYDPAGDLTGASLAATGGLQGSTIGYSYYTDGALKSVTYPSYQGNPSPTATYAYDATGAATQVTDWLGETVSFAHNLDGLESAQDNDVSSANPSGTSGTAWSYDLADLMSQGVSTLAQSCGGNETLAQSFEAPGLGTRNDDGQVSEDTSVYSGSCSGQGSASRYYSYDPDGRVIYQGSAAQGQSPANFAYDAVGNLREISSHDPSGNFDTYTQSFDNAGEVTAQGPVPGSQGSASSFTYNSLGEQESITTGGATQSFAYNSAGQLVTYAPTSRGATNYTYDGTGMVAAFDNGSTMAQLTWGELPWGTSPTVLSDGYYDYIYGPNGEPVEQVNLDGPSNPVFLTYTPDDSSWLATNANGYQLSYWRYDAYGTLTTGNAIFGTPASALGYAGQYTDPSSGLSDMRARDYQAQTGTFTAPDPALALTSSPYNYADGDPVNEADPDGLGFWNDLGDVFAGIGNFVWGDVSQNLKVEVEAGFNPGVSVAMNAVNDVRQQGIFNGLNSALNPAVGVLVNSSNVINAVDNGNIEAATKSALGTVQSTVAWVAMATGLEQASAAVLNWAGAGGGLTAVPETTGGALEVAGGETLAPEGGGGAFVLGGGGSPADMTTLYRAVDDNELADIRDIGEFRGGPNSMTGKFFAETPEDAWAWADALNGGEGGVVGTRVPSSFADQLMRWEKLDGIGPARYVDESQLAEFNQLSEGIWEVPRAEP